MTFSIACRGRQFLTLKARRRAFVTQSLAVTLLSATTVSLTTVTAITTKARPTAASRNGQCVPIFIGCETPTNLGGGNITATVSVAAAGGSIQLGCDRPDLVASPTGSWPTTMTFPTGGSTAQTVRLPTSTTQSSVYVHLYASPSGVDASNPANWTATKTILLFAPETDSASN